MRPLVKSCPSDVFVDETKQIRWRDSVSLFFQNRVKQLAGWIHRGKKKSSTASISRNHVIEVNEKSGLVSLMGGKWTAYRIQGEETVDRILKINKNLNNRVKYESGQTLNFALIGAYSKSEITDGLKVQNEELFKQYEDHFVFEYDVPRHVAKHIVRTYGTAGKRVMELGR